MIKERDIIGTDGKLFCRLHESDDDRKILRGAHGHEIDFTSLQQQIFSPNARGRKGKRATRPCGSRETDSNASGEDPIHYKYG